ncbi:unnamed protein product [Cylindrotheca closterium]|uniref:Uncharacterized protein n=1 Tax=Cylindrotheca closterium TaxID=2856 RepID=A0AAD2JH74_9STRA|nr:unnamed protein product [Cylindrotheca closterium]
MTNYQTFLQRVTIQQGDKIKPGTLAVKICTCQEADELIPDEFIQILKPRLKGFQCHPDQEKRDYILLKLHIIEGLVITIFKVDKGVIFEQLYQVPSSLVRTVFAPPEYFIPEAVTYFERLRSFFMINGWPTIQYCLQMAAKTDEDLQARMRDLPEDEFVKQHMYVKAFTKDKIVGSRNALSTSPAMVHCETVATELKRWIPEVDAPVSQEAAEAVRAIFRDQEGSETYMQPEPKALGEAAAKTIPQVLNDIGKMEGGKDVTVVIERHTRNSLKAYDEDAENRMFKKTRIDIGCNVGLGHFEDHLGGNPVIDLASLFLIFAENVSILIKLKAIACKIRLMWYEWKGGLISREHLDETFGMLLSYAMKLHAPFNKKYDYNTLDGFVSSDKTTRLSMWEARRLYFSPDWFLGPAKDVLNCAMNIGNGIPAAFLQAFGHNLGLPLTQYILHKVYGWPERIPLDPNFQCFHCQYNPTKERKQSDPSKPERYVFYCGNGNPGFRFNNQFICANCRRTSAYTTSLRNFLRENEDSLSAKRKTTLAKLEKREDYHREYVRTHPEPKITAQRDSRKHQVKLLLDETKRHEKADKMRALHEKQKANGTVRKITKTYFMNAGLKFRYPTELRKLLNLAVFVLIREIGTADVISSTLLFDMFRALVDRYASQQQNGEAVVPFHTDGRRTYYQEELYRVVRLYMDKDANVSSKTWKINSQGYNDMTVEMKATAYANFSSTSESDFAQYIVCLGHDEPYVLSMDKSRMVRDPDDDLEDAKSHKLKEDYEHIQAAYDEWYGRGGFENVPIPGGIQACEERFRSKWRTDFTNVNKKRFFDQKKICEALNEALDSCTAQQDRDEVMHQWNEMFRNCSKTGTKAATKLKNMKNKLLDEKKITRREARGRVTHR